MTTEKVAFCVGNTLPYGVLWQITCSDHSVTCKSIPGSLTIFEYFHTASNDIESGNKATLKKYVQTNSQTNLLYLVEWL